ncbi:MAG: M48 family metallopeptidase [Bacteroidetes bacterium]|nr:M48 family metallopeptidase [Bacteroidota bacterium]
MEARSAREARIAETAGSGNAPPPGHLHLDGLAFRVRRSPRRRTLALTVERDGELVVSAPESESMERLERWVRSRLLWAHRTLARRNALQAGARRPEFVPGESFSYLGQNHMLRIVHSLPVPLQFDGWRFLLRENERGRAHDHFRLWYTAAGRTWLPERCARLARLACARPARIVVRDLGFRWGSCGRNGAIYFHWRLMQLPVRLADYVIVHELTHLAEHHHGPAFWAALERALPDWRERKEQLDREGIRWMGV